MASVVIDHIEKRVASPEIIHSDYFSKAQVFSYLSDRALTRDKNRLVMELLKHLEGRMRHDHLFLMNLKVGTSECIKPNIKRSIEIY